MIAYKERDFSVCPPRDFLDDGVAVFLSVSERDKYFEHRWSEWKQGVGRALCFRHESGILLRKTI
jgi:hypothetical protein